MADHPKDDPFAPPDEPCEVTCLHCNRVYDSSLIRWVPYETSSGRRGGFWVCPVPGCGGAGFTFDIFPTNPDHPANDGWVVDDGEEDEEYDPLTEEEFRAAEALEEDDELEGEDAEAIAEYEREVAEAGEVEEAPGEPFTLEEYQRAIDEGIYEREDNEFRQRMKASSDFSINSDDDIPF
jgi:hypothetical protein